MKVKRGKQRKSLRIEAGPSMLSPCGRPIRKARERHSAIPYLGLKSEEASEDPSDSEIVPTKTKKAISSLLGKKKGKKNIVKSGKPVTGRKRGRPRLRPLTSSDEDEEGEVVEAKKKKKKKSANPNVQVKMERMAGADMLEIGLRSLAKSRPKSEEEVFGACASLLNKDTISRLNQCYTYWQDQLQDKTGISLRGNMCLGTAAQIHAADRQIRTLVGWEVGELSDEADVSSDVKEKYESVESGELDDEENKKQVTMIFKKSPTCHPPGTLLCQYCDKAFRNAGLLKIHVQQFHPKEADITSLSPGKKGAKRRKLSPSDEDLAELGAGVKSEALKCKLCDYMGTKSALAKHHRRCHVPARFYCPHCARGFSEQSDLRRHVKHHFDKTGKMKLVDVDIYKCEHCDFSATKAGLITHARSAHGVNKSVYRCNGCKRMYTDAKILSQHMASCKRCQNLSNGTEGGRKKIAASRALKVKLKGDSDQDDDLLMDISGSDSETEEDEEEDEEMEEGQEDDGIDVRDRGVSEAVITQPVEKEGAMSEAVVEEAVVDMDLNEDHMVKCEEEEEMGNEALCDVCGYTGAPHIVRIHRNHVHDTKNLSLKCPYCPRKFFLQPHRRKHVLVHLNDLSHGHKEVQCRCSFTSSRQSVAKHFVDVHIRGRDASENVGLESTALPPPASDVDEDKVLSLMEPVSLEQGDTKPSPVLASPGILLLPEAFPENQVPLEAKHVFCCAECGYIGTKKGAYRHRLRYHKPKYIDNKTHVDSLGNVKHDTDVGEGDNHIIGSDSSAVEEVFKCTVCSFQGRQSIVKSHIKFYHAGDSVKCPTCEKGCKDETVLEKHQKTGCGGARAPRVKKTQVLDCAHCDKKLASQFMLRRHMKRCHRDRCHVCDVCGKAFGLELDLRLHATCHEAGEAVCNECGRIFRSKGNLRHHIVNKHSKAELSRCKVCWHQFREKRALKKHMLQHMPQETRMSGECQQCGQTFPSSAHLRDHMSCHAGLQPYTCDKCGQAFSMRVDYFNHLRRLHMPFHACDKEDCGRKFRSKASLALHMEDAHPVPGVYPCDACGLEFPLAEEYNDHKCSAQLKQEEDGSDMKPEGETMVKFDLATAQPTTTLLQHVPPSSSPLGQLAQPTSSLLQHPQPATSLLQHAPPASSVVLQTSSSAKSILIQQKPAPTGSIILQQKSLGAPVLIQPRSAGSSLLRNRQPQTMTPSGRTQKLVMNPVRSSAGASRHTTSAPMFVLHQGGAAPSFVLQQDAIASVLKQEVAPVVLQQEQAAPVILQQEQMAPAVLQQEQMAPAMMQQEQMAPAVLQQEQMAPVVLQQEQMSPAVLQQEQMSPAVLQQQHIEHTDVTQEHIHHEVMQQEQMDHAVLQQGQIDSSVLQQQQMEPVMIQQEHLPPSTLQQQQQHQESVVYQEVVSCEGTEVITETLDSQAADVGADVEGAEGLEELFMCDLCKVIMRSMAEAQVHMETHHSLPSLLNQ